MTSKKPCTPAKRAGRLAKAEQFLKAAGIVKENIDDNDLADSLVTLCVHAGIAASDVICCITLGHHPSGSDHRNAIAMLSSIDIKLGIELKNLLDMKGHSGYSEHASSVENCAIAFRSAEILIGRAKIISK